MSRKLSKSTTDPKIQTIVVIGRIFCSNRAGVSGLCVELVDKNVRADIALASGVTDERGNCRFEVSSATQRRLRKDTLDLQVLVFREKVFLGASEVRYNATASEVIDVVLPESASAALPSEHESLTGAIGARYKGKLSDLKESEARTDISYLANKTGWDARAVALAALADQFSRRSRAAEIPAPFFYALFRAGMPANEDLLFHTNADTLETIWKQAMEKGVIPKALAPKIPMLVRRFQQLSAEIFLNGPAIVGTSSLKEMLAVSQLNNADQKKFAEIYAANRNNPKALWKETAAAFGEEKTKRLQTDGRLAGFTINNAPLMSKLKHVTEGRTDILDLAKSGYHRPEKWVDLLAADVAVPKEIAGDTPEEKRTNYSQYLAAQVRLSHPTACIAEMVNSGDLPLTDASPIAPTNVATFLGENEGKFELGVEPIHQYIARTKIQVAGETVKQVARLQRVLQLTPNDQSMKGLMARSMDSAYHITRLERDEFVTRFSGDLGGAEDAAFIHDRAVQVHNAVLNLTLGYLSARTSPAIGVHSPPSMIDPAPHANDIIAYGSLETIFGSMDYCACDHCKSLLSPAAYLVDLLQFLDLDRYDASGHPLLPPTYTGSNPLTVLLERRPDIQHLPLTCENTNTALPYIDPVLETLEYFVINSTQAFSLNGFKGHDTGGVASEDLLASPQYVMENAYSALQTVNFPTKLPFHQPLEALRRYFLKFNVPLARALEKLRKTEDLERGTNPYGWRDIWMEQAGFSREEHQILTNTPAAVLLADAYGFAPGTADADVCAGLSNARQFAKRMEVSYEDLILILKTRFINPDSDLIPKLQRLGVSFVILKTLKDSGTTFDATFDGLLPSGANAPDPQAYRGDIKAWVKDNANYARIMGLIVLAVPAVSWSATHAYAAGACVKPTTSPAGSPLYYECTTAGTSAAVQPAWPSTPGSTITDGTVVWTARDEGSASNFNNMAFRFADPARITQNLGAAEFTRFLRFIRLWKKLQKSGWTIDQTDAALCSLFPPPAVGQTFGSTINTVAKLNDGFLYALPRLGIVLRLLELWGLTPRRDLRALLACFAPISLCDGSEFVADSEGGRQERIVPSLYRKMFLNPAMIKQDAVFADNGYGEYLQSTTEKILAHIEALRSAFNLTAAEMSLILQDLGFDHDWVDVAYTHTGPALEQAILDAGPGISYNDTTHRLAFKGVLTTDKVLDLKNVPGTSAAFKTAVDNLYVANQTTLTTLTLANVSAIFRRSWLARQLKISVREFLITVSQTGLDPFALPDPTHQAILELANLIQSLKDRSLSSSAALYLIWNQDLSGRSAPAFAQTANFARALRRDLIDVETEFAIQDDPDGAVAQSRMTLVYGTEAAAFFFGLLNDTLLLQTPYADPDGKMAAGVIRDTINTAGGKTQAGDWKISYDDFRKRLSFSGVLTDTVRDAIVAAAGAPSAAFTAAMNALSTASNAAIDPFFARYSELLPLYNAYAASAAPPAEKRTTFLAQVLPELIRRRKDQQALLSISAAAQTQLQLTQALLESSQDGIAIHAVGDTSQPAIKDFLALNTQGLSVTFYASNTATGATMAAPDITANLDYAAGSGNPLPANATVGAAISGRWTGYLEAPDNGFFNLQIEADAGATITLKLQEAIVLLTPVGTVWKSAAPIELRAGSLYPIEIVVEKVRNTFRLQWEWSPRGQGLVVIPALSLYPKRLFDAFQDNYVRFLKVTSLTASLGLSATEITRFAVDSDYQVVGDNWLNCLVSHGNPAPAVAAALRTPLQALLDFARIKAEISPDSDDLLKILDDPISATADSNALLYKLTQWEPASLAALTQQFGATIGGLTRWDLFARVYDSFVLLQNVGISATALIQATTNAPLAPVVGNFQAALRARYDAADWREVVHGINDELRALQRDALVSHILFQFSTNAATQHINSADKLFEYFLMDVQMEPIMQTSRIRLALSSVQLFIERCLMNLETRVSPSSINAERWTWMKRYRIWEANRKVYLWPENWLEPELRDDKSPFFKEIESQLLQSDITADSASTAALEYLSRLEDVAKLEPCGFHYIEADPTEQKPEKYFVVARTAGAKRKYYFRKKEYGYWTAWDQIKLEIEDNPIAPYVWDSQHGSRLLLFWLRILKQSSADPSAMKTSNSKTDSLGGQSLSDVQSDAKTNATENTKVTVSAVLCWSEFHNGKWQPTKTSDVNDPVILETQALKNFDRSAMELRIGPVDDTLCIYIQGFDASFTLYNTHSLPVGNDFGFYRIGRSRAFQTAGDVLEVDYDTGFDFAPVLRRPLLTNAVKGRVVESSNILYNTWVAPFFFEDRRHVFLVSTVSAPVWIADPGFGNVMTPDFGFTIPEIILPQFRVPTGPEPWEFGDLRRPNFGVIDPAPVERLISEDVNIRVGIGQTGTVLFRDQRIGPAGAIKAGKQIVI